MEDDNNNNNNNNSSGLQQPIEDSDHSSDEDELSDQQQQQLQQLQQEEEPLPLDTKCRVFAVSDIHTDHKSNMKMIRGWQDNNGKYNRETGIFKYIEIYLHISIICSP